MSEQDTAPVLWLGEAHDPVRSTNTREDATRALAEWARARGVRLLQLEESAPSARIDLTIADRAEKELDRAREAIGSADADAAERSLARVDTLLREHPELPQAAWLRAEVERTWSQRWLRLEPRDEARARVAWENAQALDGGRAFGIGETGFPPRPKVKTTIIAAGAHPPSIVLRVDGQVVTPSESDSQGSTYAIEIAPAEHHVIATTVDGRIAFASWISIAGANPAPTRVSIASEGSGVCSREALSAVREDTSSHRVVADGVTCPHWIAASPGERSGSVLVARCERDACGPLLEWRTEKLSINGPPQPIARGGGWPAWATWTLLGIGAATATSVALVATGVFESRPVEPRFVVGGARTE